MTKSKFILLAILIFLGIAVQSLTMFRSGLSYDFGIGFWGPNGHDGVWHLALAEQLLTSFPPYHPTFSGSFLINYHFSYDLILALVSRLSTISVSVLYFQIFPVVLSFLLGLLSFLAGYRWTKNYWVGFWLAFFNYFGGSFGYVITFLKDRSIGGESLFWSMQSASTQINPPFALSLVVILAGIILLFDINRLKLGKVLLLSFAFGLLISVKSYSGVVILVCLWGTTLVTCFTSRKPNRQLLTVSILSSLISAVIYVLFNRTASALFVFQPFWFIHSLLESTDRLYLPWLASARYNLAAINPLDWRVLLLEIFGLFVFVIGNLGTRAAAFLALLKKNKHIYMFDVFLLLGMLFSLLIPLLFIQKGTPWNTIQFFYYFLFFVNFYSALALAKFTTNNKRGLLIVGFFVFATLPNTYSILKNYLGWPPPAFVSHAELKALNYLKLQPLGTILSAPYNEFAKKKYSATPLPLSVYESTSYLSAYTGKQVYLADLMNLAMSGYDTELRLKQQHAFFQSTDAIWARGLLLNNQIHYLYLTPEDSLKLTDTQIGISQIYDNDGYRIYQVQGY